MQRYICSHCDDMECETSVCPICGNRTSLSKSTVYWCDKCNTPSFLEKCDICNGICRPIATDVRPVFPEERLLIEVLLGYPMKYCNSSIFSSGGGSYIIDGKKIILSLSDLIKVPVEKVLKELKKYEAENQKYVDGFYEFYWIKNFIECNKSHLQLIETEAIDFIRQQSESVGLDSMFVSFSGGKDSTVISNLVMESLGTDSIIHIYGDTTLEYPESEEYISNFKAIHPQTPIVVARNRDQDFYNLCSHMGPPSRVMRWCCTVFKTGAISKKIDALFGNKNRIIAFHGIRRDESVSRDKYERVSDGVKIAKQKVLQPIIDWKNFDVWLYLLSKKIEFNPAYREGFSRVGCWCCPNNSSWAEYLSNIYMHEKYVSFHNQLYDFAKSIGKEDWKEYIDNGNWKARQGGNGLESSKDAVLNFTPCVKEENSYNFQLTRPLTESFYTLFIPFGIVDKTLGNPRLGEVFILDRKTGNPLLKISGRLFQNKVKISVINAIGAFSNNLKSVNMIKAQITKYQTCISCSACASICQHGAIHVENIRVGEVNHDTVVYKIDETKCVGCLDCILHFDSGCYIKKVLRKRLDSE